MFILQSKALSNSALTRDLSMNIIIKAVTKDMKVIVLCEWLIL